MHVYNIHQLELSIAGRSLIMSVDQVKISCDDFRISRGRDCFQHTTFKGLSMFYARPSPLLPGRPQCISLPVMLRQ